MTQTIIHVPASEGGGAFDPTDIEITDNTSGAFLVKEGSNEYIRIDTTNSSEQIVLKGRPGIGSKLVMNNDPYLQGSNNQNVQMASFGIQSTVSSSGHRIINKLGHSTNYFQVSDSASAAILKIEEDSNATFTLDQSETGTFKVTSDGSGSPVDMLTITSGPTSAQETVRFNFTPADRFVEFDQASFNFQCQNAALTIGLSDIAGLIHGDYNFQQYAGGTYFRYRDASATTDIFRVDRTGAAFFNLRTNGETFKVQKGATDVLSIDAASDTTLTLDASGSSVFKVQDNAGTPNEFLKIDSDTSASLIEFNVPSGQGAGMTINLPADGTSGNPNTGFQILPPSGSFKFGRQATGIYTGGTGLLVDVGAGKQLTMTGAQYRFTTSTTPIIFNLNDASGGSLQITDAADAEIFKVEEDSNLTHTLDGASAATFKVVDSNASPKTYLSITESTQSYAADPYVHKVTLGDNNGYFKFGNNLLRANAMQGGGTALYGPASYLYPQSLISLTTSQTYGDFDPCQTPYTFTMGSGATGNVTIDSGFTVRGDYQTGANQTQSFPVLWVFQNDNATHNFILSFDGGTTGLEHTKSGDTDAAALISAGGLTLTPGQRYIVRFQKISNELLLIESVDKH